ncbi:MAG: hypothetical protein NE334_03865 [Lentisphaeraceae bacterium]|nr:hypothetical protein [Lentisphaeraceae bacterium]
MKYLLILLSFTFSSFAAYHTDWMTKGSGEDNHQKFVTLYYSLTDKYPFLTKDNEQAKKENIAFFRFFTELCGF